MAHKKIIFVIVERPSDETALGVLLSKIYDKETVYIHIWHGDITSDIKTNPSNIISKIGNAVKGYAKSQHFGNKNFAEIIHITDMDGAYIPARFIAENKNSKENVYTLKEIYTPNRESMIRRNAQKRDNIDKLCTCNQVWKIPYSIYYMACNLEHVLYRKLNSTAEEKEKDSYKFAKAYKNNIDGFLSLSVNQNFP